MPIRLDFHRESGTQFVAATSISGPSRHLILFLMGRQKSPGTAPNLSGRFARCDRQRSNCPTEHFDFFANSEDHNGLEG